jgi:hypothetical protein
MGRRRRKRRAHRKVVKPTPLGARKRLLRVGIPVLLVFSLAVTAYLTFFSNANTTATQNSIAVQTSPVPAEAPATKRHARSLDDLLAMTPEELAKVEIAEMNLLCAQGLPGSEQLDIPKCLKRLDEWAADVQFLTEQNMWAFREDPGKYRNSENKFRVLLLFSVLQLEHGVHYTNGGDRNCNYMSSKNPFIHGMIDDTNGGTCASMPVLYVAIGRRIGYPMKLVLAKTHIFARWEDPKTGEKFNIEGTNNVFSDHPDSYYRNWPYPIADEEVREGWYMKSLTPAEELAVFLQNRAYCFQDNGRLKEARPAFVHSYRLAPQNPFGPAQIASVSEQQTQPRYSNVGRPVLGTGPMGDFGAPMVYREQYDEVMRMNAATRAARKRLLQSSQPEQPPKVPMSGRPQLPSPYPAQPPSPYGPNRPSNPYGPRFPN